MKILNLKFLCYNLLTAGNHNQTVSYETIKKVMRYIVVGLCHLVFSLSGIREHEIIR